MEPWSPEWKAQRIFELHQQWGGCEACLLSETRNSLVYGYGNADADIVLVGEGPGEEEDHEGVPFVGASGQLLRAMLEALKVDPNDLFITNLVMCRPPNNREPTRAERVACLPRLHEELYIVDPILVIAVGKQAFAALTRIGDSMESSRGELFKMTIPGKAKFGNDFVPLEYDVMPIYHPAFILRADSIDPKTKKWHADGPAEKTVDDLERALKLVNMVKMQYSNVQKEARRKYNAKDLPKRTRR